MKKIATLGLASLLSLGAVTTYVHAADEQVQGNDLNVQALFDQADKEDAARAAAEKAAAEKAAAEKAATEKFLNQNQIVENGGTWVDESAQADKNPTEFRFQGFDQNHEGEQAYTPKAASKEEAKSEMKSEAKAKSEMKSEAKAEMKAEAKSSATTKAAAVSSKAAPAKAVAKKALPKTSAVK